MSTVKSIALHLTCHVVKSRLVNRASSKLVQFSAIKMP